MSQYITDLELAAKAIRDPAGVAPKSIRRVRVEGKPLADGGTGCKGQRGYEVGDRLYGTVAGILADDDAAQARYDAMSDEIDSLADDYEDAMYEDRGEAAFGRPA